MSNLSGRGQLTGTMRSGGGTGGTTNYNDLTNKPKINNVELSGNKTTSDLGISYNDLTDKPTIRNVPETTGAELGSVLTHTASGEAWLPVPSELPPVASGDNGDVLTLDNGSLMWAPVSGGGSIEYSTNEKEIGTWIDGNKIYRKVIDLNSEVSVPSSSWYTNAFIINNINAIIACRGVNNTGSMYYLNAYINNYNVNLLACRDGNPASVRYIIIEYTKVGE